MPPRRHRRLRGPTPARRPSEDEPTGPQPSPRSVRPRSRRSPERRNPPWPCPSRPPPRAHGPPGPPRRSPRSRRTSRRGTSAAPAGTPRRPRRRRAAARALARSVVTLEDGGLRESRQTFLDRARSRFADTLDVVEVVDRGAHDLLEISEPVDDLVDDTVGEPRDLRQQAVAARLQADLEIDAAGEVQHRRDDLEVEQIVGVELGQRFEGVAHVPLGIGMEVVEDHETAIVVDATHELFELQPNEAAVDAQLDDVTLDLLGDAADHLGAL